MHPLRKKEPERRIKEGGVTLRGGPQPSHNHSRSRNLDSELQIVQGQKTGPWVHTPVKTPA